MHISHYFLKFILNWQIPVKFHSAQFQQGSEEIYGYI